MGKLSIVGRIFYGIAIAALGFQTIYSKDFPYMLIPAEHTRIPGLVMLAYISGTILILAGLSIIFEKGTRPISLLLGSVLLLIFCFYFIPYEFMTSPNYMQWGEWENAEKELALAAGAFVIAGCFSEKDSNSPLKGFLAKLMPFGTIVFCLTIICFGIDHFIYGKDAADYIPSWVPYHIFWIYFTGAALTGSGIAIILKIRPGLFAFLLATMIFIWVLILHIPKVITAPLAYFGGELSSAFLALAYSGIAYVIAGANADRGQV